MYANGIPLIEYNAQTDKKKVYNHLHLIIETHQTNEGLQRIVGFDVEAMSIDWGFAHPCLGYDDPAFNNSVHEA